MRDVKKKKKLDTHSLQQPLDLFNADFHALDISEQLENDGMAERWKAYPFGGPRFLSNVRLAENPQQF
jgi:hypothetical protein